MKRIITTIQLLSVFAFLFLGIQACQGNNGPKPIAFGKDQCSYCKMTISDARFATQLITKKGRVYNFDDVSCMIAFVKEGSVKKEEVAAFYAPDYNHKNELLPAESLYFLKSGDLKSPMGGNLAASPNKADLDKMQLGDKSKILRWEELWK